MKRILLLLLALCASCAWGRSIVFTWAEESESPQEEPDSGAAICMPGDPCDAGICNRQGTCAPSELDGTCYSTSCTQYDCRQSWCINYQCIRADDSDGAPCDGGHCYLGACIFDEG